jgi:hypothetical protein
VCLNMSNSNNCEVYGVTINKVNLDSARESILTIRDMFPDAKDVSAVRRYKYPTVAKIFDAAFRDIDKCPNHSCVNSEYHTVIENGCYLLKLYIMINRYEVDNQPVCDYTIRTTKDYIPITSRIPMYISDLIYNFLQ